VAELLILGDWNFVEDKIDRSPQHNDDRGVTTEMTKMKAEFDLLDGWRLSNPDEVKFSWEGSTGNQRRKIFSRIDRIYTSRDTWDSTNEYKIISCDLSDLYGYKRRVPDPGTGPGGYRVRRPVSITVSGTRLVTGSGHQ